MDPVEPREVEKLLALLDEPRVVEKIYSVMMKLRELDQMMESIPQAKELSTRDKSRMLVLFSRASVLPLPGDNYDRLIKLVSNDSLFLRATQAAESINVFESFDRAMAHAAGEK